MKRSIPFLLFSAAVISLAASCKKEDTQPEDNTTTTSSPEISISNPSEGDTVQAGTLHITGSISYTSEMHGYQVKLTNLNTSSDVLTSEEHSHGSSYTIDEAWTTNVSDTSNMQLTITAVKNHEGATVNKTVQFVCLP